MRSITREAQHAEGIPREAQHAEGVTRAEGPQREALRRRSRHNDAVVTSHGYRAGGSPPARYP